MHNNFNNISTFWNFYTYLFISCAPCRLQNPSFYTELLKNGKANSLAEQEFWGNPKELYRKSKINGAAQKGTGSQSGFVDIVRSTRPPQRLLPASGQKAPKLDFGRKRRMESTLWKARLWFGSFPQLFCTDFFFFFVVSVGCTSFCFPFCILFLLIKQKK